MLIKIPEMDYDAALSYLYNLRRSGIRLRLSHTDELLRKMGDPHKKFKSVLVGGTNGKGSVCTFIYSGLFDAGVKAGVYTSPHLSEFTERIKVGGVEISRVDLAGLVEKAVPIVDELKSNPRFGEPSFFEVVTACAFAYFAEQRIDVAVVEVGLGGRLDATNVLEPEVCVITNVSLDHTEILGDSIRQIAKEKAGIIKKEVPVVTAEQERKALDTIKETCKIKNSLLYVIGGNVKITKKNKTIDVEAIRSHKNLKINLTGSHQLVNAAVAVTALDILDSRGIKISPENIRTGLSNATWPGRFEVLAGKPEIILDCAHNPDGAKKLSETLIEKHKGKKGVFVLGVSDYKDIDGIIVELAPVMKVAVASRSQHPHAISPDKLCAEISPHNIPCYLAPTIDEAIKKAKKLADKDDYIIIAGSIFFVGDARKKIIQENTA